MIYGLAFDFQRESSGKNLGVEFIELFAGFYGCVSHFYFTESFVPEIPSKLIYGTVNGNTNAVVGMIDSSAFRSVCGKIGYFHTHNIICCGWFVKSYSNKNPS
jgi:hypothetical protein